MKDEKVEEIAAPSDLTVALKKNKIAWEVFHSLPRSHRKEYVKWIDEAKKEETRRDRIQKTIDKLISQQQPK